MRTFAKSAASDDYELPPAGTQVGTLTVFACLGRHISTWQGVARERELCGLQYELTEPGTDGRPLAVNEILTLSMNERATLFARIVALFGGSEPPRGFDLAKLLGRAGIVTVTHVTKPDGKTFANVAGLTPLLRGMSPPGVSAGLVFYDIDEHNEEAYAALPGRFRKMVDNAIDQTAPAPVAPARPAPRQPGPPPARHDFDDDIPF
jgi:hypothetical protein